MASACLGHVSQIQSPTTCNLEMVLISSHFKDFCYLSGFSGIELSRFPFILALFEFGTHRVTSCFRMHCGSEYHQPQVYTTYLVPRASHGFLKCQLPNSLGQSSGAKEDKTQAGPRNCSLCPGPFACQGCAYISALILVRRLRHPM